MSYSSAAAACSAATGDTPGPGPQRAASPGRTAFSGPPAPAGSGEEATAATFMARGAKARSGTGRLRADKEPAPRRASYRAPPTGGRGRGESSANGSAETAYTAPPTPFMRPEGQRLKGAMAGRAVTGSGCRAGTRAVRRLRACGAPTLPRNSRGCSPRGLPVPGSPLQAPGVPPGARPPRTPRGPPARRGSDRETPGP